MATENPILNVACKTDANPDNSLSSLLSKKVSRRNLLASTGVILATGGFKGLYVSDRQQADIREYVAGIDANRPNIGDDYRSRLASQLEDDRGVDKNSHRGAAGLAAAGVIFGGMGINKLYNWSKNYKSIPSPVESPPRDQTS